MNNDLAAVTKQVVSDDRADRRARRLDRQQAVAEQRAELQEKRGMYAIALQALSVAFLVPENNIIKYRKPCLIVRKRLSIFSVAGYTLDYGSMLEERLHVSLTGDFYLGYKGRARRVDPWTMNPKDLRELAQRLRRVAQDKDILGDLVVELP